MLMLNWIFGKLDGTLVVTLEGGQMLLLESVESIRIYDLHLPLLGTLLLLKKEKYFVVSYRPKWQVLNQG